MSHDEEASSQLAMLERRCPPTGAPIITAARTACSLSTLASVCITCVPMDNRSDPGADVHVQLYSLDSPQKEIPFQDSVVQAELTECDVSSCLVS